MAGVETNSAEPTTVSEPQVIRRRWHIYVAWLWAIAFVLTSAVFIYSEIRRDTGGLRPSKDEGYRTLVLIVISALAGGTTLWTCWVVPPLSADHLPSNRKLPPRKRVGGQFLFTMSPALILLTVGGIGIYIQWNESQPWQWSDEQMTAVALLSSGSFAAAFGWWLFRVSVGRLRRAAARLRICFKCGYDLRGSPGSCPECGATVTVP